MNLTEYASKIGVYEQFCITIKEILSSAITNADYKYHLQQIQYRAKTFESLAQRLKEKDLSNAENVEELRHDLAGCRVIFYYNDDVNAFLNSGLVRNNFKVHWDKSKIHGPKNNSKSANDYYTANHFVVELDESRSNLPEYVYFKGLKCEIQIHTVLNHAWAETAHNITYKKPEKTSFGYNGPQNLDH